MKRCITLSLLQFLQDAGFGVIDESLFWEKLGVNANGVYIVDLGAAQTHGGRRNTMYQLFSRGDSDLAAMGQLQVIIDFLRANYARCSLPPVLPYTSEGFNNVTIMPPSDISNEGVGEDGHIIYSSTGQIYY